MVGCKHVEHLDNDFLLIGKSVGNLIKTHRRFRKYGFCTICKSTDRLYFCLFCPSPFCFNHYDEHLSQQCPSTAHPLVKDHDRLPFGVNIDDTKLFCFACRAPAISEPFDRLREALGTLQPSDIYFSNPQDYVRSIQMMMDVKHRWSGCSGLANAGNHCYANAVLQIMMHSAPLIHVFCASSYHANCDYYKKTERNKPMCLRCEIRRLFSKYTEGHESTPLNAFRILFMVNKYRKHFDLKTQQDCNEFTLLLFELIRLEDAHDRKIFLMSTLVSPIDALFTGKTHTLIICTICGHRWTTGDTFTTFAVPIRPSIKEAFEVAFNDEHNHSYCIRCGQSQKNLCRKRIQAAPVFLPICLQRFVHGKQRMIKVTDDVEVNEELDVGRFLLPEGYENHDDWDDDSTPAKRRKRTDENSENTVNVNNDHLMERLQSIRVNENTTSNESIPEVSRKMRSNPRKRSYPHDPVVFPKAAFSTVDCKYVLIGVVYHRGKIDSGHYFSRCVNDLSEVRHHVTRNADGVPKIHKFWAEFDDRNVSVVRKSKPPTGDAYMAFYVQEELNSVIDVQAYLRKLQPVAIIPQ